MGLKNKRGNHKADYDRAYARDKARSLIAVIENVFADMSCSGAVKCQSADGRSCCWEEKQAVNGRRHGNQGRNRKP